VPDHVMLIIADATVRVTLLLAGGWALTALMRRASASARHFAWMCTIVVAAAMPAAAIVMPDWNVPYLSGLAAIAAPSPAPQQRSLALPAAGDGERPSAAVVARQSAHVPSDAISYSTLAFLIWIAGAVGVGVYALSGVLAARRLRRHAVNADAAWVDEARVLAEALEVPAPIAFLESDMTGIPMVCGLVRPGIVMPLGAAEWPAERLRVAVLHELAHVRRRDCLTQAFAQLVCALYWFSPLVWLAARRLRAERERACDDFVLQAGTKGSEYATHLLEIARTMGPRIPAFARAGVAMAHVSQLEGRLMAILNPAVRRSTGLTTRIAALTTILLVAVLVAAVQPQEQAGPQPDARQPTQQKTVHLRTDRAGSRGGWSTQEFLIERSGGGEVLLTERRRGRAVDRALVEAAGDGDVQGVNDLLVANADVNAAIVGDGSPLIAAARAGRLEMVRLLLDRGADPKMPVPGDGNPIIGAAIEGRPAVVELLLQRGADINQVVDGDENALIQVSGRGQLDMVKLLVSRGANVNAQVWVAESLEVTLDESTGKVVQHRSSDGEWRSPLSEARRGGHTAVIDYLIATGAQR
jgi:beta-lactamase regulating signal transducer with metallopeptidase domain